MIPVQLNVEDWNKVLALLAQAPWHAANPLIMQIGDQLRRADNEGRISQNESGPRNGNSGHRPTVS